MTHDRYLPTNSWVWALALSAALWLVPGASWALTPLDTLQVSPDITVDLSGTTVEDEDLGEDDLAGTVGILFLGTIPSSTDLDGAHELSDGNHLLSFDTTVVLAGGTLTVGPEDVVEFDVDTSTFSLLFDGSAEGLPRGVNVDAVSVGTTGTVTSDGDLLLSFDTTVTLNGVTFNDEDVALFDGTDFSLVFDASDKGVNEALDLDGLHYLDGSSTLLVSFDGSGTVGGVAFDDEDALEVAPWGSPTWESAYDGSDEHTGWPGGDLDALTVGCISASNDPAGADLNDDGIVNILDISLVGSCFSPTSSGGVCQNTDTNCSGSVGMDDIQFIVGFFGQTVP